MRKKIMKSFIIMIYRAKYSHLVVFNTGDYVLVQMRDRYLSNIEKIIKNLYYIVMRRTWCKAIYK